MTTWTFISADGQELCAGYQGEREHAHALAARLAEHTGVPVEYIDAATGEAFEVEVSE